MSIFLRSLLSMPIRYSVSENMLQCRVSSHKAPQDVKAFVYDVDYASPYSGGDFGFWKVLFIPSEDLQIQFAYNGSQTRVIDTSIEKDTTFDELRNGKSLVKKKWETFTLKQATSVSCTDVSKLKKLTDEFQLIKNEISELKKAHEETAKDIHIASLTVLNKLK